MSETINKHLEQNKSFITQADYHTMYQRSINSPKEFWSEQAQKYIDWSRPWDEVLSGDLSTHDVNWFPGAKLNVCVNCIDRHLPERANQTVIIWEGDDPAQSRRLTYAELHQAVCRFANGLKSLGVKRGDRICIYMPMIPEAAIAMLACARIGAVHSVVFAGFSSESLKHRVQDAQCSLIITADGQQRHGKNLPLKAKVDDVIADCPSVKQTIIVEYTKETIQLGAQDIWYHELVSNQSADCPAEEMEANEPLFILYTSGSTGTPKGILHGQGGYLLYATMTFKLIFNYQDGDIYWSSADIGWITGHSYVVYGPLSNGATTLMFAGTPTYPSPARFWEVIDKHHVNIFYTAPTAIRALMREGDDYVKSTQRTSLKLLGSVGEPINPDAWLWYYHVVGESRCAIVDTWWQTETGGIMIAPLPGATPLKPGAASWPFFDVQLAIVDNDGHVLEGEATGNLVVTKPWPGQLKTVYGDQPRFIKNYFTQFPNLYNSSDESHRDEDGYYWIMGRTDDVINVSGHRLDTVEIENVLVSDPRIAEAAVVGYPHDIKGQGIVAFVTPLLGVTSDSQLIKELTSLVSTQISPIAKPDHIQVTEDLPKTRSGKIMRRILRKIVLGEIDNLGDISTLANPHVVEALIEQTAHKTV